MAQGDAEFAATLERLVNDQAAGDDPVRPNQDPREQVAFAREQAAGRTVEDFRAALEHCGYVFFAAEQLGRWNNGMPHTEGMWVHANFELEIAFTETDVARVFQSPEDLANWTAQRREQWASAGHFGGKSRLS